MRPSQIYLGESHTYEADAHIVEGGGKGKWSAWKAGEMARRYEAQGGDYKDTGDNKNKVKKGEPEKK